MKISHVELEKCVLNPRSWVAQRISPPPGGPRTGYDGATKLAIYKFHGTASGSQAQHHLSQLLSRLRLTNTILTNRAMANLDSYIEWCVRHSPVVSGWKLRLDYDLGNNFALGGEISRIDVDIGSGGYRGVLLGNRPTDWRRQLRVPLIQRALAAKLQRPESEISVGFQNIDGTQLELISFPRVVLNEAEDRTRRLTSILSNEWRRQKGL
jgi:hypothetical protein